jgi:hypothetical protein
MFDFNYDDRSINLWRSYIVTLQAIVKSLPHTESLNLDFSHEIREEYGNDVINSLSRLEQLRSLSICKMHVDATELIKSLLQMTQLGSFSISELKINGLNSHQLGQALEVGQKLEILLPRLSKLKLSNSWVENESIVKVLPHIRGLLSNLTSLDLSNNNLNRDALYYNIVPAISGYVSNLRSLNLSDNEIGMYLESVSHPIIPLIQTLNNLEELSLSNINIDGNCIAELIPTLRMLPLRKLDLSSNNLGAEEIILITKSLPMLKVLDVSSRMECLD